MEKENRKEGRSWGKSLGNLSAAEIVKRHEEILKEIHKKAAADGNEVIDDGLGCLWIRKKESK